MKPSANLDILRAIAVLAVFLSHAIEYHVDGSPYLTIGRAGVLLFFVHTAYVLMQSLERQDRDGTENRWSRFMVRRAFRIYPLSIVACALYISLRIPGVFGFQSFYAPSLTTSAIVANLGLFQNIINAPSSPNVLWSLPFEVQMYLVLPAIYAVVRYKRTITKSEVLVLFLVAALYFLLLGELARSLTVFVPCFLCGVLAYRLGRHNVVSGSLWIPLVVALVLGYSYVSDENCVQWQWLLCLAVGLSIPMFREIKFALVTRPAAFIAKYSYGLYLFHFLAMWVAYRWLGLGLILGTALAFLLSVAISVSLYRIVEEPFISLGRRLSEPMGQLTESRFRADSGSLS